MTKSTKMIIAAAAMTGLLAGATAVKASTISTSKTMKLSKATTYGVKAVTLDDDKHECKGKNDCKGKGGCKTDSHECKGKNDCKGKGGCKTEKLTQAVYGQKAVALDDDKHECKGKNDCKGKGGCKTDSHECKGKNDCKGKGGCKTDKLA